MTPGQILDGTILVCPILNDPEGFVLLPLEVAENVKKSTKVTPVWPLGIYAIFVEEGMGLGVFGFNEAGALVNGVSHQDMTEDKVPEIGEEMWKLWKLLRSVSDDVVNANFIRLRKASEEAATSLQGSGA